MTARRVSRVTRFAGAAAFALLLGACASSKQKPTPLEAFTPALGARQVWAAKVDAIPFPLSISTTGGNFTVASGDGTVLVVEAETGREVSRTSLGGPLSAAVGTDGRFTSAVTRDNELIVAEGGAVKWRTRLNARVTTAPLVAGERVFVMGVDRVVNAFDALDGRKLWTLRRPGEPLTLSQAGVVTAFKDTLVVGQGARLTGVDPLRGTVRWEVPIASPRGTNEVERLADLVGPVTRIGDVLCARAFQSAVGCADAERGALVWSRNQGGTDAVSADADMVIGADASDRMTAWKTGSGDVAWTSERLLYRGLSAPVAVPKAFVFGDVEGQVHFLSRDNGLTLQRLSTDGSPVIASARSAAGTILMVTRNGGLFAYRIE